MALVPFFELRSLTTEHNSEQTLGTGGGVVMVGGGWWVVVCCSGGGDDDGGARQGKKMGGLVWRSERGHAQLCSNKERGCIDAFT